MENLQTKQLIERIEGALKQTEWELQNIPENNVKAFNLITGRRNGYNHVLEMIKSITFEIG